MKKEESDMSDRTTNNYEAKCLLELLSALLNHKELPRWRRQPDWGGLYKTADYHNVANDVYYMLMGMDIRALKPWKKKFEERFHEAARGEERYREAVGEVLRELEFEKIHCMVLKDYTLREYYPRKEMRALDAVEILVEKGRKEGLDRAMYGLDFLAEEIQGEIGYCYYKIPGIHLVFKEELQFTNKKMKNLFVRPAKAFKRRLGFRYVHEQKKEELYLFVIGCFAENYARGRLELRELMDFWYYYLDVYMTIDWEYVTEQLERLELSRFADYLVKLIAYWFGEMLFPKEMEMFGIMEEYIISKGMKGRKESAALLPLVKEVLDFYKKDLRKERRQKQIRWLFPQMDYMEILFPFLRKRPSLIWLCWVLRLFRSSYFSVKNFLWDKKIRIQKFQRACIDKWNGFWLPKIEYIKMKAALFLGKIKARWLNWTKKCKRKKKKDTET